MIRHNLGHSKMCLSVCMSVCLSVFLSFFLWVMCGLWGERRATKTKMGEPISLLLLRFCHAAAAAAAVGIWTFSQRLWLINESGLFQPAM